MKVKVKLPAHLFRCMRILKNDHLDGEEESGSDDDDDDGKSRVGAWKMMALPLD